VFKFGGEYNDTGLDQIFKGNWRGVYIFNSEADLLAGHWSQYRQFAPWAASPSTRQGRRLSIRRSLPSSPRTSGSSRRPDRVPGPALEGLNNPDAPVLNLNNRTPTGR